MAPVKTLTEYSLRAIAANMDCIDSLGNLPYRLAKPILLLMSAEKLMEIEKNSPVCPTNPHDLISVLTSFSHSISRMTIKVNNINHAPCYP